MFCVLLGILPPDPALWARIRSQVVLIREDDVQDDDDVAAVSWGTSYSLVKDEDNFGVNTLVMSAATEVLPEAVVAAVQSFLSSAPSTKTQGKFEVAAFSCQLWASAPAPLPLRPLNGYSFESIFLNDSAAAASISSSEIDEAARAMQEWGIVVQPAVLKTEESEQWQHLCRLVNNAIGNVDNLLAQHRPDLVVGRDVFCFKEMASRNVERFDLRLLLSSEAGAFISHLIQTNPAIRAMVLATLGIDIAQQSQQQQQPTSREEHGTTFSSDGNENTSVTWDISVVYSRPGACTQGWHADGQHQPGASDAGWNEDGWKTHLAHPYAICLFVPLIDLDETVGYTQFWPGSHRYRNVIGFGPVATVCNATYNGMGRAGDGIWYDYRLLHQGMPNRSKDIVRPVLQIIFKKAWYVETANYGVESIVKNE